MTYALSKICCANKAGCNWVTIPVDTTVVITSMVVGGSILGEAVAGIPKEVGGALIGFSLLIPCTDLTALAIRCCKKTEAPEELVDVVADAPLSFNKIEEGLFLGSKDAFLGALDENPHGFTTIITAAPLLAIKEGLNVQHAKEALEQKNILWLYPGKMLTDRPNFWPALVYDCTFSDELSQIELTLEQSDLFIKETCREKSEILSKIPVSEWFEPVFQAIDQGIEQGRVLVHCEWGQSRSATILAAYLIKRKRMTCDQTLDYLRLKRPEVDSKFYERLKEYEIALSKN